MNNVLYATLAGGIAFYSYGILIDHDTQSQVIPASGVITIKNGTTEIVSGMPLSINPLSGEVVYAFTGPEQAALVALMPVFDLRVELSFSAPSMERVEYLDVLPNNLISHLTDEALRMEDKTLLDRADQFTSEVTADGTDLTLLDNRLHNPGNYWQGSLIRITKGANQGQVRTVVFWDSINYEFTVDRVFDYPTRRFDCYTLIQGYKAERNDAYLRIVSKLNNEFGRDVLGKLLDIKDLTLAHKYLTLSTIFGKLVTKPQDSFHKRQHDYQGLYDQQISTIILKINQECDNSGSVDELSIMRAWAK